MRRVTVVLIALTVSLLIAAGAQASTLDPPNTTLNVANLLEDNDYEAALRGSIAGGFTPVIGAIAPGDFLLAIAEFSRFAVATAPTVDTATFSSTTSMLTAVSLQKVLTVGPDVVGGNTATITGGTASVAEWLAITGLGVSAGTVFQAYDDPIPAVGSGHLDNTSVALGLASASEGLFQYDIGFTGAAGEFLTMFTTSVVATDPTDLSTITVLESYGNLNVISQAAGTPELAKHNFLGTLSGLPAPRKALFSPADLQLQTNLGTVARGGFAISTDTDAYIKPIPEPTAFTLAALALLTLVAHGHRRRRS